MCWKPGTGRIAIFSHYLEVLNTAKETLIRVQNVSMAINANFERNIFLGTIQALQLQILQQKKSKLGYMPVFSIQTLWRYLNKELGWTFRSVTKASQKLLDDGKQYMKRHFSPSKIQLLQQMYIRLLL